MDATEAHTTSPRRRSGWRALVAAGAIALGALGAVAPAQGDLASRIAARQAAAERLRSAIAAETQRIQATADGVAQAQARLDGLQARMDARRAEVARIERERVAARDRLTELENRYHRASQALAANLRATYQDDQPDLTTVLIEAKGFADLLERIDFLERVAERDAQILGNTRTARIEVVAQAERLASLQARNLRLTAELERDRDAAAAVQTAMLRQQAIQLRGRADRQAELDGVRGQLASLQERQARAVEAAERAAEAGNPAIASDPGGMAQAPAGAPAAVAQVIAAGNAIAGLPYSYGGGHASFQANAYDCSGSVSYALAAAGLVSSPLNSTGFESWGEPGPGQWITVYANAGHAFMIVAGWRFDTGALSSDGTRWSRSSRSTAGFVARHPPGL